MANWTVLVACAVFATRIVFADSECHPRPITAIENEFLGRVSKIAMSAVPPAPKGWLVRLEGSSLPQKGMSTTVCTPFDAKKPLDAVAGRAYVLGEDAVARHQNALPQYQKLMDERKANETRYAKDLAAIDKRLDAIMPEMEAAGKKQDMEKMTALAGEMESLSKRKYELLATDDQTKKMEALDEGLKRDTSADVDVYVNPFENAPSIAGYKSLSVPGFDWAYESEDALVTYLGMGAWKRSADRGSMEAILDVKAPISKVQSVLVRVQSNAAARAQELRQKVDSKTLRSLLK